MRTRGASFTTDLAFRSIGLAVLVIPVLAATACGGSDDAPAEVGSSGSPGDASEEASSAGDGGLDQLPYDNADPRDLDPANGDPSLDIAGSWIYFDGAQPWVRAEFFGSWPPPQTLYSWSCSVLLGTANAPLVTYTVTSLSGTQTQYADGLDEAKITFTTEAKGFRVLFADATLAFDRYALECNVKKANEGTLAQDASGSFEVSDREQRSFGP